MHVQVENAYQHCDPQMTPGMYKVIRAPMTSAGGSSVGAAVETEPWIERWPSVFLPQFPKVSLTRSPPTRSVNDQGEGLLLNSYDRTLIVKQISGEDVADMHNILSEYHQVSWSESRSEIPFGSS